MRLIVHVELSGDCADARDLFPIVQRIAKALNGTKDLGVTDYLASYNTHGLIALTAKQHEASKRRFEQRWQKRLEEQS